MYSVVNFDAAAGDRFFSFSLSPCCALSTAPSWAPPSTTAFYFSRTHGSSIRTVARILVMVLRVCCARFRSFCCVGSVV